MKRLMVVYNPRSSQYGRVRDEVLATARTLKGWTVGKFEVADTDVDDNAVRLAKLLNDGDLVVSAGGDGTATIGVNGVMLSKARDVMFGVLGYGNFNDMARTFGTKSLEEIVELAEKERGVKVWPMECLVNGKHWRYGMCYFTVGLFAEACKIFDEKDKRRELRTGQKGIGYSIGLLARWYFGHRKQKFMGDFELIRGMRQRKCRGMSDYVAVNGRSMAKVMRGDDWFLDDKEFLAATGDLRKFWGLLKIMVPSVVTRIPGVETRGDVLEFGEPGTVMLQGEGEYKKIKGVERLEFCKAKRGMKVLMR